MSSPGLDIDVVTLFPEVIESATALGVLGRARDGQLIRIRSHQLRDFTGGSPHPVDDAPYGGGPGMVMRPEPIFAAMEGLTQEVPRSRRILITPQGRPFDQATATRLAGEPGLVLFCGRYEGVDERVRPLFHEEISIGDYILSGGEFGALVLIDAIARLVPGVLGCGESSKEESFSHGLLEYPQYTRPAEFRGVHVPPVLTSGNHAAIRAWRREQSLARTRERRPDLLAGRDTSGNSERADTKKLARQDQETARRKA